MKTSLKSNIRTSSLQKVGEGFIPNRFNWTKPSSWPELRHITPDGAIGLLLCDKYPQIGFRVTCSTGNYKVFIDDKEYLLGQNKSQTNITVADITTPGILVNHPEPLTVHTVFIIPSTQGDTITAFQCRRTEGTSTQSQGLLWVHFNMSAIGLIESFSNETIQYVNPMLKAITCSKKTLEIKDSYFTFCRADLQTAPVITNLKTSGSGLFRNNVNLKKVRICNSAPTSLWCTFADNTSLEELDFCNFSSSGTRVFSDCFKNNSNLKKLPPLDFSSATDMIGFITNATAISVPLLDVSSATNLNKIECFGTSQTAMCGFKGLVVCNSAPFNGSAPQINIAYTGLDRTALIALFNSLPQVAGGRKINIVGVVGNSDITTSDLTIATSKGWEVLQ